MTLISSISGIRGTIGGFPVNNLTPIDIINYSAAYSVMMKEKCDRPVVMVGRDGRVTGPIVQSLVMNTLLMMGVDVLDCGLTTTPTIEMGIVQYCADGGIMISASHNPMQWNALKLFNSRGEFIDGEEGARIKALAGEGSFEYCDYKSMGKMYMVDDILDCHIDKIIDLPYVDIKDIRESGLRVAVDGINSTGGFAVPRLLERLGIKKEGIIKLNCDITGEFSHNPEPLAANLVDLSAMIRGNGCDFGIAVDPDVDRLALMCETGDYFGEEYTLVACADYVLSKRLGNTVSNLSSSRALKDLTLSKGGRYFTAPVGEVNVVRKMKACEAVIGGEGNGGVILPELHYGRDSLLGIALITSFLAESKMTMSQIRKRYTDYYMAKDKIDLKAGTDFVSIKDKVKDSITDGIFNEEDGLKIDFPDMWVHLRTSNTEPIIRVYSEAKTQEEAEAIARRIKDIIMR